MTPAAATAAHDALRGKEQKLEYVKEQFRIRDLGLGWTDVHTPWSVKGKPKTSPALLKELVEMLEKHKDRPIPNEAPVPSARRKNFLTLGTKTTDAAALEAAQTLDIDAFKAEAARQKAAREAEGVGDPHGEKQPPIAPAFAKSLVGAQLEVCRDYTLPDETHELLWCSCKVSE